MNSLAVSARTNEEWIRALSGQGQEQAAALEDLRTLLLRATLYTLVTHLSDVSRMEENDRLALAEDCAQDALNSVLFHLSDFRGESQFTTWAYKFGINTALSRARRERWKAVSLDELSEDSENADWLQWREELQIGSSETPVRQAEVGQILREVIRSELTEKQRQVLKWIAFDDVPMDVVTERLDTNRNAVYKLLHDSRMKVRRRLAAEGYEVEEVYALFQADR